MFRPILQSIVGFMIQFNNLGDHEECIISVHVFAVQFRSNLCGARTLPCNSESKDSCM